MRPRALLALVTLASLSAAPAYADDDAIPGHSIDRPVDGGITALATGGALALQLIPMRDHTTLWSKELVEIDEGVHDNFSPRAAHIADGLLAASLVAPVIYLTGSTIDDADGDRLMIYGESMAINALFAQGAKYIVQRPRPYNYSKDPAVRRYAVNQGGDAFMSFYSGHAALSFGAATTGAYLLGASSTNGAARGLAWGLGLGVASATATLRVRAGKHFYSDVIVGAAMGLAIGYIVPALHADGRPYIPSGQEIAAAAGGIFGGMLLGRLMPLEKQRRLDEPLTTSMLRRLTLSPVPMQNGMGFAVGGAL